MPLGLPPRRRSYVLAAIVLSSGAPLGLLLIRSLRSGALSPSWVVGEVSRDPVTYAYLLISTTIAFSLFGDALGRQAERLVELSSTDPLTGLKNTRFFRERLRDEVGRARRYCAPLSLLFIDLDRLKQINDRFGHQAGDAALVAVAEAIRKGARETDVSARWGGDEFALLAPNTSAEAAAALAERVRSTIAAAARPDRLLTVSIGVASLDSSRPSIDELMKAADAALYDAKRLGRDRVAVAPGEAPWRLTDTGGAA